jgi:DNA invertase Pin-like site-specific DNA recombinase
LGRKLIAYYRVSTKQQGQSGLGLDAQSEAVAAFAAREQAEILHEFTEVESGSKNNRPQLQAAIAAAKATRATLVVAKLDRLARNVAFLSSLLEGKVDFVACDMPQANKLTVHIMAAVAEYERDAISARTKAALAQAKARGVKLGSHNRKCRGKRGREALAAIGRLGTAEKQRRAREFRSALEPVVREIYGPHGVSPRGLAEELNRRGYTTRRGRPWDRHRAKDLLAALGV